MIIILHNIIIHSWPFFSSCWMAVQWTESFHCVILITPEKLQSFPPFIILQHPTIPTSSSPWILRASIYLRLAVVIVCFWLRVCFIPLVIRLNSPYNQQDYWIYHHHNNRIPEIFSSFSWLFPAGWVNCRPIKSRPNLYFARSSSTNTRKRDVCERKTRHCPMAVIVVLAKSVM